MVEHLVAERTIICHMKNGEYRAVKLQIGLPLPVNNGESWECEVALEGLYPNMPKVPGIDSLQCVDLAMSLIRQALGKFIDGGGRIHWRDGSGPIKLSEIFA